MSYNHTTFHQLHHDLGIHSSPGEQFGRNDIQNILDAPGSCSATGGSFSRAKIGVAADFEFSFDDRQHF